jgi:hypothetical protein
MTPFPHGSRTRPWADRPRDIKSVAADALHGMTGSCFGSEADTRCGEALVGFGSALCRKVEMGTLKKFWSLFCIEKVPLQVIVFDTIFIAVESPLRHHKKNNRLKIISRIDAESKKIQSRHYVSTSGGRRRQAPVGNGLKIPQ